MVDSTTSAQDAWREDAKDAAQLNSLPEEEGVPVVNTKQSKKSAIAQQEAVPKAAAASQQGKSYLI